MNASPALLLYCCGLSRFLGGLFAAAVLIIVAFNLDVPVPMFRGVEGLAFGVALAVIPYCLARAFDELASEVDDMDLSDDVIAVRVVWAAGVAESIREGARRNTKQSR